jgi:hypothetical protein
MSGLSIKEVELRISQNLQPSLKSVFKQAGYSVSDRSRLCVSLVDASGRKKRSNAKADNWSPDSGWLQVWFEPVDAAAADAGGDAVGLQKPTESPAAVAQTSSERASIAKTNVELGLAVVIRALARAEKTPGWSFVSLKKFQNEILSAEASQLSPIDQRHFLGRAINERLILTNRVANPKDPRFPVTTIRLDRLNNMVQEILGEQTERSPGFAPIHIKGEPLSATILRERR